MSQDGIDEQLMRLQTRIAYQDHLLATLDEVVREFAARVQTLEREMRLLRSSMGRADDTGPANDPPPHY